MRDIDKTKPVLVTGGSGYLASWIIKMLVDEGREVRATVRDPDDPAKTGHLSALEREAPGRLSCFAADLLEEGSFDAPMENCELVIHTASPFFVTGVKNPQEQLIRPAKEGTGNVLASAKRTPSVKRVVLTSSVAAIYGDNADIAVTTGGVFTEEDWNQTSSADHQPYPFSKTVAEKEAWAMAEQQDRWDLVAINPGWILGPSLSSRTDSMSIKTMIEFGKGTYKSGVPKLWNGIVDVRDVAQAHIRAGFTPEAGGRYIVVNETLSLLGIAQILRQAFGGSYPFPRREAPKLLFWLVAPLYGYSRPYVSRNVDIPIAFDNARSRADLGMTYIPVDQTIREHFQQILDDGLLK